MKSSNLCTSTSNLVDEYLADEGFITTQISNFTTPRSGEFSIGHNSDQEISTNKTISDKEIKCYCSLNFKNRKKLRRHITRQHMRAEQSNLEDKIGLNVSEEIHHQNKKKKG